MNIEQT